MTNLHPCYPATEIQSHQLHLVQLIQLDCDLIFLRLSYRDFQQCSL